MDLTTWDDDYQYIDGIEDVSLSGSFTDSEVKAVRSQPKQPPISGGEIGIDVYDAVFDLWAGTCGSEPFPGDVITDSANTAWSILAVTSMNIGSQAVRYQCQCRKQVS